jgi:hypothetical protein
MSTIRRTGVGLGFFALLGAFLCAAPAFGDEIRLKDGKKLYGVIVGYEENMFKVKTDFGYVLVEKDKIAAIIPETATAGDPAAAKSDPEPAKKPEAVTDAKSPAPVKSAPAAASKEKPATIVTNANVRPELPITAKAASDTNAPALKTAVAVEKTSIPTTSAAPPPPLPNEEIQGNLYINREYGFRMYKAPSWQIIEGAGQALPNAIVAMGTANESTLLIVGHEKTKGSLEGSADTVEKRLHDVYENYRLLSQRKTVVGGQPAIEYRYRGKAEEHDWSGTLSVIARNDEYITVLGMTFGDSDLIQIQENVILRSIASLDFSAK